MTFNNGRTIPCWTSCRASALFGMDWRIALAASRRTSGRVGDCKKFTKSWYTDVVSLVNVIEVDVDEEEEGWAVVVDMVGDGRNEGLGRSLCFVVLGTCRRNWGSQIFFCFLMCGWLCTRPNRETRKTFRVLSLWISNSNLARLHFPQSPRSSLFSVSYSVLTTNAYYIYMRMLQPLNDETSPSARLLFSRVHATWWCIVHL